MQVWLTLIFNLQTKNSSTASSSRQVSDRVDPQQVTSANWMLCFQDLSSLLEGIDFSTLACVVTVLWVWGGSAARRELFVFQKLLYFAINAVLSPVTFASKSLQKSCSIDENKNSKLWFSLYGNTELSFWILSNI